MTNDLRALVDGWRGQAKEMDEKSFEKDSGGSWRFAEWARNDLVARASAMRQCANALQAALDAQAGMVMVPRVPTEAMIEATRGLFREWHEADSESVYAAMLAAAQARPVVAQAGGWRTVAEATPEVGQLVAVHSPGAMICDVWPARYTRFGNFDAGGGWFEQDEITHWMPLPAGPVEGGGNVR